MPYSRCQDYIEPGDGRGWEGAEGGERGRGGGGGGDGCRAVRPNFACIHFLRFIDCKRAANEVQAYILTPSFCEAEQRRHKTDPIAIANGNVNDRVACLGLWQHHLLRESHSHVYLQDAMYFH